MISKQKKKLKRLKMSKSKPKAKSSNLVRGKETFSQEILEEAKELFMTNMGITEIARHLNIPRTTLQYYQNKSKWKEEREQLHIEEFSEFMNTRQSDVTHITRDALSVMKRGLNYLNQRTAPPTIDEVGKAAKAMETLAKISRDTKKEDPQELFEASFESQGELQEKTIKEKKAPKAKEKVIDVPKDPFEA
jgi:epoxyqueuosine reductase QueG